MSETLIGHKEKQLKKLSGELKTLRAKMESDFSEKSAADTADVEKFDNMFADGQALKTEIENLYAAENLENFEAGKKQEFVPTQKGAKTFGAQVIESEQFKSADRQRGHMGAVEVPHLMKGLYNTTDAQGGYAVRTDREPDILDIARQRPASILDLIMIGQTSVDAVEYVLMASRTNNAAPVLEWDAAVTPGAGDFSNKFGIKPQGDLTLDLKTANVKTIAEWIPASRQILNDAPNLRSMVDNELMYQLLVTLENEILAGSGSGVHFTGINNWSGIQTRQHRNVGVDRAALADDTLSDTIRRSLTDIRLEFYEPDGIVLHPTNAEAIELEKDDNGNYLKVYDPVAMRMWRVKVVETQAQTANTATVGQFKLGAKMWDREQSNIRVGEPGNFFLQNAVAILAELRAAFAVTRPKAIEKVNLVSA